MTLPQIKRMLETVLPLRRVTKEVAMELLVYTIKRNHTAYLSHRKKRIEEAMKLGCEMSL
jgi:hypothetical protein